MTWGIWWFTTNQKVLNGLGTMINGRRNGPRSLLFIWIKPAGPSTIKIKPVSGYKLNSHNINSSFLTESWRLNPKMLVGEKREELEFTVPPNAVYRHDVSCLTFRVRRLSLRSNPRTFQALSRLIFKLFQDFTWAVLNDISIRIHALKIIIGLFFIHI